MAKGKQSIDAVVPITNARTHLFDLVEDVLSGRTARIEISHRNHEEHLLLVRKRDVLGLEEENRVLRSKIVPEPAPLRGMGRLVGDAEHVVARLRARQEEHALRKRASLLGVRAS